MSNRLRYTYVLAKAVIRFSGAVLWLPMSSLCHAAVEPAPVTCPASLDTIAAYRGEKNPAILVALVSRNRSPVMRQRPVVALSDGISTVAVTAQLGPGDGTAPNFAVSGAKLVSMSRLSGVPHGWAIQLLPDANTMKATLTILNGAELIIFPLTLAPSVPAISRSETVFRAFLADSGATPPKHDLNGDGRHDYLDDYIYTVNYVNRNNPENGTPSAGPHKR